nr:hypothetical protein [Tanacetum cinerariifolium]
MTYDNVRPIFKREYNKVQTLFKPCKDVEEPQKKRVAEETPLQESFKKLKVVEVSSSESTQETPTNDPKEMSEEDVQNMLEIVSVSEFKVEALQVKYPLIDWEIHSEGSRSYWKIIRAGGITKAYQSFEDMLKGFDREDLDALWRLVKEKFSSAVPIVDKEKALWVEPIFKREYNKVQTLFKPYKDVEEPQKKRVAEETLLQESFKKLKAVEVLSSESTQETPTNDPKEMSEDDVHNMLEIVSVSEFKVEALQVKYPLIDWEIHSKLQRYMHDPLTWKLYTDCEVHHLSSTRRHDIFMLTEKDYPLSNVVMIMMLSAKLQVEEDSEMARDLVMKIFDVV